MYSKQIEIPKIVWSEFLGVWFHKDIDFETYDSWFDKRYNCFAQAFKFIKELGIGFYDEKSIDYNTVFSLSEKLTSNRMPRVLVDGLVKALSEDIKQIELKLNTASYKDNLERALRRNQRYLNAGKMLDGMDSLLVAYSYVVANNNADKAILVCSCDKSLVRTVNILNDSDVGQIGDLTIPKNVKAQIISQREIQ